MGDETYIPPPSGSTSSPRASTRTQPQPTLLRRGGTIISLNTTASQQSESTAPAIGLVPPRPLLQDLPDSPATIYQSNPPASLRQTRAATLKATRVGVDAGPRGSTPGSRTTTQAETPASPAGTPTSNLLDLPPADTSLSAGAVIHSRPTPHTSSHPEGSGGVGHFISASNLPIPGPFQSASGVPASAASRSQSAIPEEDEYEDEYEDDEENEDLESDDDNHVHRQTVRTRQVQMTNITTSPSVMRTRARSQRSVTVGGMPSWSDSDDDEVVEGGKSPQEEFRAVANAKHDAEDPLQQLTDQVSNYSILSDPGRRL